MAQIVLDGDTRVVGNLVVTGTKPTTNRSELVQDSLASYIIPVQSWRVWDAMQTNLPGTAATDDLEITTGTFGTAPATIQTGDLKAAGATTRYARTIIQLPPEYVAAETVVLRARAGMLTTVADTTTTIDFEAYKLGLDQTVTGDLVATAATTINSLTATDIDFTVTATSLAPGDFLDVRMAIAVNDAATGTAVIGLAEVVALLCDIKG